MRTPTWNRRQLLQSGTQAAAALALTPHNLFAAQQLPPPEPFKDPSISFVTTTEASAWQPGELFKPTFRWDLLNLNIHQEQLTRAAASRGMQGFGGCFNELGWTSLSALNETDRESILHEFFDPHAGARFNYCRMPIGANDYATEAYSYDEVDGDFDLKHFTIDHDRKTLVPFIHAAQRHRPDLRLWASPWSPPSWMKRNHFYAEAPAHPGMKENGIRPDQIGHEGENLFIQEPRYFDAYARYFARFIQAYREQGIHVGMVMPQNEFNSAQNFPSCTWTPEGLVAFLQHLGPQMQKLGVDIFFGTLERGDPKLLEAVMSDPNASPYIKGVGIQWAGKNALPEIHHEYPTLPLYQSEQECGDGANSWAYTGYCWQLMKDYFRNGATAYMYWNISTPEGGLSTWGWNQNALVTVNQAEKTFRYHPDYYLLKHLTHFVDLGAKFVETTGTCDDALAFLNPDGSTVLLLRNELAHPQMIQVQVKERIATVRLPPDSVGTLHLKA